MQYSIIEKLNTTTNTTTGDLSPVYIGLSKKEFVQPVQTVSSNYFTLTVDPNYTIDPNTILLNLFYWKMLVGLTAITTSSLSYNVNINIIPLAPVQIGDTFVIVDGSNNLTFSSTITNIIFSGETILSITLYDQLAAGVYNYSIIRKTNEILPSTYNTSNSQVTFITTGVFYANNFTSIDYINSYIKFFAIYNNYEVYKLSSIEDINDNLQNFSYNKLGFAVNNHFELSSSPCVAITIPDITYIQILLDDLEINNYGYILTPVGLNDAFLNYLSQYINKTDKKYALILSNNSISNSYSITYIGGQYSGYVYPDYVDNGYVG